jgi:FkbM family methyltransferase
LGLKGKNCKAANLRYHLRIVHGGPIEETLLMGVVTNNITDLFTRAKQASDEISQNFRSIFFPQKVGDAVGFGRFRNGIAIVTPNEVNDRHGTGVIISRAFAGISKILSIRSSDLHGDHQFGDVAIRITQRGRSRYESYSTLVKILHGNSFRYIICVPYHPDDLVTAIVLKELYGARLCIYVMDDNHLGTGGIPEALMREALEKADLRLAISPEMRDAYEYRFRLRFWLRPPVVTPETVSTTALIPATQVLANRRGVVVGSVWSNEALESLAEAVSRAQVQVDWYGNSDASWLNYDKNRLAAKGIRVCGFIPEAELTKKLAEYAYALVPSGTLDGKDPRPEIAQFSLPTRMPFLLAVGNMPTIVLGNPRTAAARFVERFEIGRTVSYHGDELRRSIDEICTLEAQTAIRGRAASFAQYFSAEGVGDWILRSMDLGQPASDEIERIMSPKCSDSGHYLAPQVPEEVYLDFRPTFIALKRLNDTGFEPEFIIDVGASTGIWSKSISVLFPKSRFLLVEPLLQIYQKKQTGPKKESANFEIVPVAISNQKGIARFQVSADLYGSSLLNPSDSREYESIEVPVTTLDDLAIERSIKGRGILKLDIQFAEHLALEGGRKFLDQVDVVIVELTLMRLAKEAKTFLEMVEMFRDLGFRYYDDVGEWRSPQDGTLIQKDVVFVRNDLTPFPGALD